MRTTDGVGRDPPPLAELLRGARAHRRPFGVAHRGRPDSAPRPRRHGALQALLPGRGQAAVRPRHQRPEVRAHAGHRRGRQDHPARHVLPDVRQLLLRRLLQGGRRQARLGAAHHPPGQGRLRPGAREALDHRLRGGRRGRAHLARHRRCPRRADPAPGQEGQLLVHGRPRPLRPLLRDQLRPRPRVRRRGRPRRQRRAVRGDLEPRLHAVRAGPGHRQGGLRDPRRPAEQEHRHRSRSRTPRHDPPGRAEPVRDRHLHGRHRQGHPADRCRLRRRPRLGRLAARGHRPHAHLRDADRRRRHPGQRGPRLRAAPHHAPRHPQHAPPGGHRPGRQGPHRHRDRDDGAAVPGADHRPRAHREGRPRGGGPLPQDPQRRHQRARHRRLRDQGRRLHGARRRQGVPPPRHLGLPHRPHPGDGRRAGAVRGRGRLPPSDEGAAGARQGRRPGQEDRPRRPGCLPGDRRRRRCHRLHRLHRHRGRVHRRRHPRRRRLLPGRHRGRRGRDRPRPHPVLRRGRRPDRRHRPDPGRLRRRHRDP